MTTIDDRQVLPDDSRADGDIGATLEPRTLARLLAEEGPMPMPRALVLLRTLGRQVDGVHARGTVHGAVRPWRVVVEPSDAAGGEVRLVLGPGMSSGGACRPEVAATATDGYAGAASPSAEREAAYRSPQLLAGEDARTMDDVYALGVIAYELLTGSLPFAPGTAASLARRPRPPGALNVELSAAVEGVMLAQVKAAPSSRFTTGLQFVSELERAASPNRASIRPASIADLMSPPTALPASHRARAVMAARDLALTEMPDMAGVSPDHPRPRLMRRTDYPSFGLPGLWVAVIVVVLCSVYLLPGYYMLRRFLGV